MNARRVLACMLLVVAGLLALSQMYLLFTLREHPMLPHFRHSYLFSSSIESFGFAIPAMIAGYFLLRSRKGWLWWALIAAGSGLWLFVVRELWLYYFYMPSKYPGYADSHRYFNGLGWWTLIRLSWHIMLPAAFILAVILLMSRAPNQRSAANSRENHLTC